ncbi:MAG: glutamate racemase [Alphaproteobacteria bacterium]|nr:glutamate racemase [Alphaproteobacteria bacterium]
MTPPLKRVLLFDSGVGGLSVFDAIVEAGLPVEIDYVADAAWLPYGEKPDDALRARVPALIAALERAEAPDLVVLACNTASTIALAETRAAIAVPVVGVVPPIKPAAALTRTGVIGVLATPATIRRPYTDALIREFAADVHVIRVGDAGLVAAAEAKLSGAGAPSAAIADAVAALFGAPRGDALDVVALACTHFPLLREELAAAAPRPVAWLESGAAIARRVAALLGLASVDGAPTPRLALSTALAPGFQRACRMRGFTHVAELEFDSAPRGAGSSRSVPPDA